MGKDRLKEISNKSGKKLDLESDWGKAYTSSTKMNRQSAIYKEVADLLTLFTNHRFFSYKSEPHRWFVSNGSDEMNQQWGQPCYLFPTTGKSNGSLSSVESFNEVNKTPIKDYHTKIRDAFYVGSKNNEITFPSDIDVLFDKYFNLSEEAKLKYYNSCCLYNQALELKNSHASLSLIALVTSIEALTDKIDDQPCEECNAPPSVEVCKCGLPRHRVSSNFKNFVSIYGDPSEEMRTFANKLYRMRSVIAHGGLLRADQNDSGFHGGGNDEQDTHIRLSEKLVHKLIINWLIKQSD